MMRDYAPDRCYRQGRIHLNGSVTGLRLRFFESRMMMSGTIGGTTESGGRFAPESEPYFGPKLSQLSNQIQ